MTTGARNVGALLIGLLAPGCLALPWVTPPLAVDVGAEARGVVDTSQNASEEVDLIGPAYGFALHPLQSVPSLKRRAFDFGLGWRLLSGDPVVQRNHGPFLEGTWFFMSRETSYQQDTYTPLFFRAGLSGQLRLHDLDAPKPGGAVRISGEWVGFVSGAVGECEDQTQTRACYYGAGHGEVSAGFYLDAGASDFGTHRVLTTSFGVIIRSPTSAGLLFLLLL